MPLRKRQITKLREKNVENLISIWKGENIVGKVIICANQKGGVAKSTSVVNFGVGLASNG
jgi:Mrp family chromosome partitioning ATPase